MINDVGSVEDVCVFCEKGFEEDQETSRIFLSLSDHDDENCVFAKVHNECAEKAKLEGIGNAREVALDMLGPLVSYKRACEFLFVNIGMFFLNEYSMMYKGKRTINDVSDSIERQIMFKGAVNIIANMFEKTSEEVVADACRGRSDMTKVIDFSFLDKTLYSRLEELDDEE